MAERLKAPVLKTGSGGNLARGFESLPRRLRSPLTRMVERNLAAATTRPWHASSRPKSRNRLFRRPGTSRPTIAQLIVQNEPQLAGGRTNPPQTASFQTRSGRQPGRSTMVEPAGRAQSPCERSLVGDDLLQLRVLLLQQYQPRRFSLAHRPELQSPPIERLIRDPQSLVQLRDRVALRRGSDGCAVSDAAVVRGAARACPIARSRACLRRRASGWQPHGPRLLADVRWPSLKRAWCICTTLTPVHDAVARALPRVCRS